MAFKSFVPLIMSQILGREVFQVLHTSIKRNKWLAVLVSQVVESSSGEGQLYDSNLTPLTDGFCNLP